jgi:CBS domain-containing protein
VGGFRHVPVVDAQGKPVGLVGVRDVLRYLADYFPQEVKNLPPHTQSESMPRHGG